MQSSHETLKFISYLYDSYWIWVCL